MRVEKDSRHASCLKNVFHKQSVHDIWDVPVSQIVEETVEVVKNGHDWYYLKVRQFTL